MHLLLLLFKITLTTKISLFIFIFSRPTTIAEYFDQLCWLPKEEDMQEIEENMDKDLKKDHWNDSLVIPTAKE